MGKTTALEPTWWEWVKTNVRRECSRELMVEQNFDAEFASAVVAEFTAEVRRGGDVASEAFAKRIAEIGREIEVRQGIPLAERAGYVGDPSRLPDGNVIAVGDHRVHVLVRLKKPEVLLLGNVLSGDECAELIRRSEVKLARSTTIDPQTGQEIVIENRTSSGTFFHLTEDDFIARIDRRLSELLRWLVDHSEGLQILRYQVGGEYRPHFDYFPPGETGSGPHVAQGGQRIGTLVMYLNDVEDGGETIFPEIGLSVVPRRGKAVYFGYCNSRNQVDPLTLHGGSPVRSGVKWIATKWLRQHRRA